MGKHWFEEVAETLGESYLKYSFTRGTNQEVDALVHMLEIAAPHRILDVGCGPGRHAVALGERGFRVHGIDISERFIEIARQRAADAGVADRVTFEVADARTFRTSEPFDRLISLCQGAFGLAGGPDSGYSIDPDLALFENIVGALGPSGRLAVSAFSAYFQVRMLSESDQFDAARGVNHEHTVIKDEFGADHQAELWTTCVTPRELRLIASGAGLTTDAIYSVRPGSYVEADPNIESEEFLLLAIKP
ncbi:MAG: class I SAM-dependent methyltransferase [Acidimicrobiia bacterium]|nr:class I SAM-dependent methyltransferase [Acidimicrobiia bacterium]